MPTQTAAADRPAPHNAPTASPRMVVWRELPAPTGSRDSRDALPRVPARDTWYDPAALYEEPERWDGMA